MSCLDICLDFRTHVMSCLDICLDFRTPQYPKMSIQYIYILASLGETYLVGRALHVVPRRERLRSVMLRQAFALVAQRTLPRAWPVKVQSSAFFTAAKLTGICLESP